MKYLVKRVIPVVGERFTPFRLCWLTVLILVFTHAGNAREYSLQQAIDEAQRIDPWLQASEFREQGLLAKSVSEGSLPDPGVSIGVANLPVDSFDFNQEAMTQFKVGINQMFPRGNTRALKEEKFERLSQMQPLMREDRKAKVAVQVSHLWLEVFRSQKTLAIIDENRNLFEHLVEVAQSSYTAALGKTSQQDFVRAQLELTRLDDRLTKLKMMLDSQKALLGEWLQHTGSDLTISMNTDVNRLVALSSDFKAPNTEQLGQILSAHPMIRSINQKIEASETDVELSRQNYKPQWGVNASYAYRGDDPMGNTRSDFFSAGLSFDLPLFAANRQDKQTQAAVAEFESVKTERALALRKMRAEFESAEARFYRLLERRSLFDQRLLKEMADQAEASLNAYTNNNGDFAEVVRARIAELNARIEALNIAIDIQKTKAQLHYFLLADHDQEENQHE